MDKINYSISLNETNAIKGFAIIAMLLHHLFYTHPEYGVMVHQIGLISKVCVAMFLFLSGYGLTVQFSNLLNNSTQNRERKTVRFVFKRLVKFYLSYWVIFLIFVPLGVLVFGRGLEVPYGDDSNISWMLFKDICGINDMQSYNITWWFNKLILTLYILFPLLYLMTRNKYLGLLLFAVSYKYVNYFPFISGIMVATHIDWINNKLSNVNIKVVPLMAILCTVLLCVFRQMSTIPYANGLYLDSLITMSISLLLISASRICSYSYRILSYLGKHSMNMYMIHTFIFVYFFNDFIYGFKYPILIFIALLLSSLAVSIIVEELKKRIGLYRLQDYLIDLGNRKL